MDGLVDFDELRDALDNINFLQARGDEFRRCFESETARKGAEGLRRLLAKDLLGLGFVGYRTMEMMGGQRSDKCYALFSPDAFQTFVVKPLDVKVAEKAIEELHKHEEYDPYRAHSPKNYQGSNEMVDAFMKEYGKEEKTTEINESTLAFDRTVRLLLEEYIPTDGVSTNEHGEKQVRIDPSDGIYHTVEEIVRDCQADPDERFNEDSMKIYSLNRVEGGHYILEIGGGCNGGGSRHKLVTYCAVVKKLAKKLYDRFGHVWLVDWKNDCCDDVWTLRIAFEDERDKEGEETRSEIYDELMRLYAEEDPVQEAD